jgi:hypothetical protein
MKWTHPVALFGVAATVAALSLTSATLSAQSPTRTGVRTFPIAEGWAANQVNAVIFRRNSLTTHGDTQYAAFYDGAARVVLAKRESKTAAWQVRRTEYEGDARDAHKSISIAVDGQGFVHVAWNMHDTPLLYRRSLGPGSLELARETPMRGDREGRVTYPEFYNLPGGDLLFLYRDGASGGGNLVLNRYDVKAKRWSRLQDNLIGGEGVRNAYWQMAVDARGAIHLSWVWRETPDVMTNHDLCYAKSPDGGRTWHKSSGEKYRLPITAASAEYVLRIPQGSELINQTSMSADAAGRPYIASYWRPRGTKVPQYQLVYHDGRRWLTSQITRRTTPFSLSGRGTRRIPVSRPQVLVDARRGRTRVVVVFRDIERGERVSVAVCEDVRRGGWSIMDLTEESVGMWEPTYDAAVWDRRKELHLFVQKVGQGQGEGVEDIPAQVVSVLEWKPGPLR